MQRKAGPDWAIGSEMASVPARKWRRPAPVITAPSQKPERLCETLVFESRTFWERYCRSGKKPIDIPAHPEKAYANAGWSGWVTWLRDRQRCISATTVSTLQGSARVCTKPWTEIIKSEWIAYRRSSGKKPNDIPANPDFVYANDGWARYSEGLEPAKDVAV